MLIKKSLCLLLSICFVFMSACNRTDATTDSAAETSENGTPSAVSSEAGEEESIQAEEAASSETEASIVESEFSENSSLWCEASEQEESYVPDASSEDKSCEENSTEVEESDTTPSESEESDLISEDVDNNNESGEAIDPKLEDSFVIYGSPISYSLEWESDGLELYNTEFRMSEALAQEFKNQINSFANAQSIMLIELDTNMTFAYSKDTKIATASSIKGPVGLYVNKCIDAGLISWDTYKSYQPWHFQEHSTGTVQNYSYGTAFRVETLMDYMIRISDNQAYLMLKELVGASNFNHMMETLGCSQIIPNGANWGYITAQEMAAAWREIYYYSLATDSGAQLFDRYMHAQYNYIWRSIPQYEAAHKSGWSGKAFNDAGVVFADGHEYVLVVLCGRSGVNDPRSQIQFTAITKLLAKLMVEYNAYKVEMGL